MDEFTKRTLNLIKRIPQGKITTYRLMAEALDCPMAARRVGRALSQNTRGPKIPCHRVIKSDGSLGGYNKGVSLKKRLLIKEKIEVKNNKVIDFKKYLYDL